MLAGAGNKPTLAWETVKGTVATAMTLLREGSLVIVNWQPARQKERQHNGKLDRGYGCEVRFRRVLSHRAR